MSAVAPENSLSAIRLAKEAGAAGVEVDLRFTADGVAVLAHDGNMRRMSGVDVSVATSTFAELRRLNIAAGHPRTADFPDERVRTPSATHTHTHRRGSA
jgi:glycerophosphoryl diester phosphodiesterase